jgi:hypothetical protein
MYCEITSLLSFHQDDERKLTNANEAKSKTGIII